MHFKQACFITTTIIIKYKPTWSINYQKQTENTLLQHIFQSCLVVMLTTFTTTAPLLPSSDLYRKSIFREMIKYQANIGRGGGKLNKIYTYLKAHLIVKLKCMFTKASTHMIWQQQD